jgi:hypothetical protein
MYLLLFQMENGKLKPRGFSFARRANGSYVVCPFDHKETIGSYPFVNGLNGLKEQNGLNGLNGTHILAHLRVVGRILQHQEHETFSSA